MDAAAAAARAIREPVMASLNATGASFVQLSNGHVMQTTAQVVSVSAYNGKVTISTTTTFKRLFTTDPTSYIRLTNVSGSVTPGAGSYSPVSISGTYGQMGKPLDGSNGTSISGTIAARRSSFNINANAHWIVDTGFDMTSMLGSYIKVTFSDGTIIEIDNRAYETTGSTPNRADDFIEIMTGWAGHSRGGR